MNLQNRFDQSRENPEIRKLYTPEIPEVNYVLEVYDGPEISFLGASRYHYVVVLNNPPHNRSRKDLLTQIRETMQITGPTVFREVND